MNKFWVIMISIQLFNVYMLWRNDRVYKFRVKTLRESDWVDRCHVQYDSLPHYQVMLFKFWIWPLDRFLPAARPGKGDAGG